MLRAKLNMSESKKRPGKIGPILFCAWLVLVAVIFYFKDSEFNDKAKTDEYNQVVATEASSLNDWISSLSLSESCSASRVTSHTNGTYVKIAIGPIADALSGFTRSQGQALTIHVPERCCAYDPKRPRAYRGPKDAPFVVVIKPVKSHESSVAGQERLCQSDANRVRLTNCLSNKSTELTGNAVSVVVHVVDRLSKTVVACREFSSPETWTNETMLSADGSYQRARFEQLAKVDDWLEDIGLHEQKWPVEQ
jgi:hypothetical protein